MEKVNPDLVRARQIRKILLRRMRVVQVNRGKTPLPILGTIKVAVLSNGQLLGRETLRPLTSSESAAPYQATEGQAEQQHGCSAIGSGNTFAILSNEKSKGCHARCS